MVSMCLIIIASLVMGLFQPEFVSSDFSLSFSVELESAPLVSSWKPALFCGSKPNLSEVFACHHFWLETHHDSLS